VSELSRALLRKGDGGELPRLALRPREAAKALGVGERLLFDLTKRGEIPHVRLGNKCIVYPVDALRNWLAEQAAKGGQV
jgi:excisionase family DNA binding protein